MGVPGYFSYARRVCKTAIKRAGDGSVPKFDVLYVDFNCLIHNAVRPEADAQAVIYGAIKLLGDVAAEVGAPDVIVCTEGVCPEAKMAQQRNRRFMAVKRDAAVNSVGAFDRNKITPGTVFMEMLDRTIGEELRRKPPDGRSYTYSGSDVAGEGEQKILEEIRKRKDEDKIVCIYGLDADLVLLCGCLKAQGIRCPWLCREELSDDTLTFVDAETLIKHVSGSQEWNHVICSFLCGNDFLPPLSCLQVNKDLRRRREICHTLKLSLVSNDGSKLNWRDVGLLLETLADTEDMDFRRADSEYWALPPPPCIDAVDRWNNYPSFHKDDSCRAIRPGEPDWRTRYYVSLFGLRNPATLRRITGEYIRGLQWTFDYYRGAFPPSVLPPAWSYPWEYGPTTADLHGAVCETDNPPAADLSGLDRPIVPPERLLAFVTPEGSFDVLPPNLRERGPRHLFPTDARIATYLHRKVWHCKAVLPRGTPMDVVITRP
jgi:5'-3' exonuclease